MRDGSDLKMPMLNKNGQPRKSELPSTIRRSDAKAQRTFAKAHDSAVDEYGEGERAHRVAFSALKHTHEKVGDHWQPKNGKGPSDKQAAGGKNTNRKTRGGVDANASKEHLYAQAKKLDISGRSKMNKDELVKALQKASKSADRKQRSK